MKPHKTLIIDIANLTGKANDFSRYNPADSKVVLGFPRLHEVEEFLSDDLDAVFCVESPYTAFDLFTKCKERGIKTVMQYNWEFLEYLRLPHLPMPDVLAGPTKWNWDEAWNIFVESRRVPMKYLPFPVNTEAIPKREITEAKTFVHVAGHETKFDRNSTSEVIQAIMQTDVDARFIIYSQHAHPQLNLIRNDPRVEVRDRDFEWYWELYDEGDVLLLPRKYGGLCLPMQEAMAAGMLPVMTDVEPNNLVLPQELLIPTINEATFMARTEITAYFPDVSALAARITDLASGKYDIEALSKQCYEYAQSISWDAMKEKYIECLTPSESQKAHSSV